MQEYGIRSYTQYNINWKYPIGEKQNMLKLGFLNLFNLWITEVFFLRKPENMILFYVWLLSFLFPNILNHIQIFLLNINEHVCIPITYLCSTLIFLACSYTLKLWHICFNMILQFPFETFMNCYFSIHF